MGDGLESHLSGKSVVDAYFLEHRAKLLDIAAFMDRIERADGRSDFRMQAFERCLRLLVDGRPERARRVLDELSDPSEAPLASAAGLKGALGACPPLNPEP